MATAAANLFSPELARQAYNTQQATSRQEEAMGVIDIGATVPRRKLRVPGTPPGCLLRTRLHAILDEVADKRVICTRRPRETGGWLRAGFYQAVSLMLKDHIVNEAELLGANLAQ